MKVSSPLQTCIEKSLDAIKNHPQHDLNLGYRQEIWSIIDSLDPHSKTLGHQKRTALAILSANYVLPIWETQISDNFLPHTLLKNAIKLLQSDDIHLKKNAENLRDSAWSQLEQMATDADYQTDQGQQIVNVGLSAVSALATALYDEIIIPDMINYDLTDADVDAYNTDASFWAASAYGEGAVWQANSSPQKRYEFWYWWLTTAVPESLEKLSIELNTKRVPVC